MSDYITLGQFINANGIAFDLFDWGRDGQYLRYVAAYKPFPGKLGETFKVVLSARTKRELREKMEGYPRRLNAA